MIVWWEGKEGTDLGAMTVFPYRPAFRPLTRIRFGRKYKSYIKLVLQSRFDRMYSRLRRGDGSFCRGVGGVDSLLLGDECSEMRAEVVPRNYRYVVSW